MKSSEIQKGRFYYVDRNGGNVTRKGRGAGRMAKAQVIETGVNVPRQGKASYTGFRVKIFHYDALTGSEETHERVLRAWSFYSTWEAEYQRRPMEWDKVVKRAQNKQERMEVGLILKERAAELLYIEKEEDLRIEPENDVVRMSLDTFKRILDETEARESAIDGLMAGLAKQT